MSAKTNVNNTDGPFSTPAPSRTLSNFVTTILPKYRRNAEGTTRFDAVALSGGGMKGIATIGALLELQEAGWLQGVTRFAGTSVGAVLATMLAIDANLSTVFQKHVLDFTYETSYDISGLDKTFGLDTGEGLEKWIHALLGDASKITFTDVLETYGSTLLICASNLNTKKAMVFGPETHPDMLVAQALRMSCSIPLYFAATTYKGELYVDGALTDNFPIGPASGNGHHRVLGIRLANKPKPPDTKWTLESFIERLADSATTRPIPKEVDAVILEIDPGPGTQPMNFRMSPDRARRVLHSGKTQAKAFIYAHLKKDS
jgi:predicted acylesterase/phospholipase RssA